MFVCELIREKDLLKTKHCLHCYHASPTEKKGEEKETQ